jgi:F-type H+-transporting ATPase subunit b
MLIDWFTVGAQTLNFLVLVWLLKRFLYKPITDAIDAREQRIAAELADAANKQATAQQERDTFREKNATFDQQRDAMLRTAKEEAAAQRQQLLDDARQETQTLRTKRLDALASELSQMQHDIAKRSRQEVMAIAQKVLADLADASLEERLVQIFTDRLRAIDAATQSALAKALNADPCVVQVRSAFVLSPTQRDGITQALGAVFSGPTSITFDVAPDLLGGIALTANGWKLTWNIANYLESLGQSLAAAPDDKP